MRTRSTTVVAMKYVIMDISAPFTPNINKENRKIREFITKIDSPTENDVLLDISKANISVPSKAPPFRRTIPIPIPSSNPPISIRRMKLPSTKGDNRSKIAVDIVKETIPSVAKKANLFPKCLNPIRTNGILNINNSRLSENPKASDSIMEIPVIPPSIKPFGISITSKLRAVIIAPMIIHGILNISSKK